MKTWQWVTMIVVAVAALLAGAMLGPLFLWGSGPSYRGGMMGGYSGMMGGFAPFGWIGMLLMMLFSLGFLVLLVLGIVWLVNALSRPAAQQALSNPSKLCPNCHKPVQADWQNCPYCGTALG